jgi:hypothetical protein
MGKSKREGKIERDVMVAVGKLHPNPWNPNKTTQRQQQAIGESLDFYGQVLPLIIRPHPKLEGEFEIIDGEHRYLETDPDFEVNTNIITGLTDAEAKKLTIVLNETRGQADKIELAALLSELDKAMGNDLMTALPYDPGELDELIKLADYDWDSFESTFDSSSDTSSDGHVFKAKLRDDQHDLVTQTKALVTDQLADANDENALLLELLCKEYLGL